MTTTSFIQGLSRVTEDFIARCKSCAEVSAQDCESVAFEPEDGYFRLRMECKDSDDVFVQEFEYGEDRIEPLHFFHNNY